MENLKVMVSCDLERDEAHRLLREFGYRELAIVRTKDWVSGYVEVEGAYNQISIEALRDLVHAKKNSENEREMNILDEGRYVEKEYINKTTGEYRKTADVVSGEQWIEVPDGADELLQFFDACEFYKGGRFYYFNPDNEGSWNETPCLERLEPIKALWQRSTKPEELLFVDDEPKGINKGLQGLAQAARAFSEKMENRSLNDQYAEIEKVRQSTVADTLAERQSTYGCFEDVAFVTEGIMDLIDKVRPNGLKDIPMPHRMALYMIASKIARLANGDINHLDSWHDIGGYSKLIENLIGEKK